MRRFILNLLRIASLLMLVNMLGNLFFPLTQGDEGIVRKEKEAFASDEYYSTIFMGSSRTYRHINPQLFNQLTGQLEGASYNLGVPATFVPEIFYCYEQMLSKLESSESRTIIMELQEINLLAPKNLNSVKGTYWLTNDYLILSVKILWASKKSILSKSIGTATFGAGWFINHFGFNYLIGTKSEKEGREQKKEDGFACLTESMANITESNDLWKRRNNFLQDTTQMYQRAKGRRSVSDLEAHKLDAKNPLLQKITQLIERSAERGVNLVFVLPPRLQNYKTMLPLGYALGRHRFIDLSSPDTYPQLWRVEPSFDISHLNCEGANLYTQALVEQLEILATLENKD